jgi:hypothetical protein
MLLVVLVVLVVLREWLRSVVWREGTVKEGILHGRLLRLDVKRRSRGRRWLAIGQLLGHLLDRKGGRVNVHDGVTGSRQSGCGF